MTRALAGWRGGSPFPHTAAGPEMLKSNGKGFEIPGVLWRRDDHEEEQNNDRTLS